MEIIEENRNIIIEIIKKNDIIELKNYIKENNITLNELYTIDFDILIYSIENNISNDIIKYIIKQSKYETFNYHIIDNNIFKSPLFSAIGNNNFEIANILLKNKADINYNNGDIINNLNSRSLLNNKNLKYILNNDFNIEGITDNLIYNLIDNFQNKFLETIFKHFKFNNSFILNFLNLYKSRDMIIYEDFFHLNEGIEESILNEKDKIYINDTMYDKALEKENYEALRILYENENSEENEILNRIIKYDLLELSVKTNNYNFVKNILYYQSFDCKYIKYEKIINEAIENNNIEIAKLLIKTFINSIPLIDRNNKKFNKIYQNQCFNLILNLAIKSNNMTIIHYIMDKNEFKYNTDINIKDIKGEYPILKAFYFNNIDIFKYLLDHGANCNVKNNNGVSLLMLAIHQNKIDIINLLLKYHVNINEKDHNGITPLEKAVNQNNSDIVRLFINHSIRRKIKISINDKDASGNTPLIKAVNQNNATIVKLLINYCHRNKVYININEKDANGNYPLMKAIDQNNFDIVFSLVNYVYSNNMNINMNIVDIEGNTPLTLAYKKNYIKIFRYLTSYLDIHQKDSHNNSILYYAIDKEDTETVKDLINIGMDINIKNAFDDAAIDRAIFKGNLEIINILLDNDNLLLNKRNYLGKTPLISIIKADNYSLEEKERIIDRFIEKGSDVNLEDKDGNSPLVHAIKDNHLSIIKLLIRNGANVNMKNKEGNSPLVYAIQNNNLTVVKLLTENGADVHIKNNEGNSSLEYAVNAENCEIANYLYNYMDMVLKTLVCKNSVTNCTQKLISYINNLNTTENVTSFNSFSKFSYQPFQNYRFYNKNRVV